MYVYQPVGALSLILIVNLSPCDKFFVLGLDGGKIIASQLPVASDLVLGCLLSLF
jgi:hypothetical protein